MADAASSARWPLLSPIVLALKAGNDLKRDRRQVFELGILMDLYTEVLAHVSGRSNQRVQLLMSLLPMAELPGVTQWSTDPDIDRDQSYTHRDQAMDEVVKAILQRSR